MPLEKIMAKHEILKEALDKIFSGIQMLCDAIPSKEFTIDGRLVGDIGEAIAQRDYQLMLYDKLVPGYDAETLDGRLVQIKATFKKSLTFKTVPDYYIGLKLNKDGSYEEIFNGPGSVIQSRYGHRKGFGKELLSFPCSVLKELSKTVPREQKINLRHTKE